MLFLQGNVIDCLKTLPDQSIHCCITSPPYYGLRAYGTNPQVWGGDPSCDHQWIDSTYVRNNDQTAGSKQRTNVGAIGRDTPVQNAFCSKCGAWLGELGLEPTPELYVEHLVMVFREVKRVLRDDGCLFLNLGDSYAHSLRQSGEEHAGALCRTSRDVIVNGFKPLASGYKEKDLIGIPWMVAFALRNDGWYLRSDTIWAKGVSGQESIWQNVYNACLENKIPKDVAKKIADSANPYVGNPMPESVKDRPTRSHEYIFLLTKSQRYFYDHVAVQEDCVNGDPTSPRGSKGVLGSLNSGHRFGGTKYPGQEGGHTYSGNEYAPLAKRNMRDVIVLPTQPFKGSHFAVMPESLVEPFIKMATSEKGCCPKCGAPFVRIVEKRTDFEGHSAQAGHSSEELLESGKWLGNQRGQNIKMGPIVSTKTLGWQPTCSCGLDPIPCVALDPFGGSGTVAKVSRDLGRDSVYIDLNPQYVDMAMKRVGSSLFNSLERKEVFTDTLSPQTTQTSLSPQVPL